MAKAAEANTEKSKVVPAKGTPGNEKQIKSLATYYLLGKSGLKSIATLPRHCHFWRSLGRSLESR